MAKQTEYKVIKGSPEGIEGKLNELSNDGWRPITMGSTAIEMVVAVILERQAS